LQTLYDQLKVTDPEENRTYYDYLLDQIAEVERAQSELVAQYRSMMDATSDFSALKQSMSNPHTGSNAEELASWLVPIHEAFTEQGVFADEVIAFLKYVDEYDRTNIAAYQEDLLKAERYSGQRVKKWDEDLEQWVNTDEVDEAAGLTNLLIDLTAAGFATDLGNGSWELLDIDDLNIAAHALGISADYLKDLLDSLTRHGELMAYAKNLDEAQVNAAEAQQRANEQMQVWMDMQRQGASQDEINVQWEQGVMPALQYTADTAATVRRFENGD
jgi:hypothetical protein